MHLYFKPGSRYSYSGDGLNLIQLVIEQKKGRLLDQLMQDAFFAPLGMSRTGIIYRAEFAGNVADRYNADGSFHAQTKRFPARAAGSMTASAKDIARFVSALFADTLLKPATRKTMLTPAIPIRTGCMTSRSRPASRRAPRPRRRARLRAGLGAADKTRFGPAFFKEGHGDGAQNYMICFERRQACTIVLTNSDNGELAFRRLFEKIWGIP